MTHTIEKMEDVGFELFFQDGDQWIGGYCAIEHVDQCSFARCLMIWGFCSTFLCCDHRIGGILKREKRHGLTPKIVIILFLRHRSSNWRCKQADHRLKVNEFRLESSRFHWRITLDSEAAIDMHRSGSLKRIYRNECVEFQSFLGKFHSD